MRGLEPPTSASQTLTLEARIHQGINKVNLAKLSNWYLTDRINTKGLTHFSQVTIEGHFRRLLQDFDTVPNSIQLDSTNNIYCAGEADYAGINIFLVKNPQAEPPTTVIPGYDMQVLILVGSVVITIVVIRKIRNNNK